MNQKIRCHCSFHFIYSLKAVLLRISAGILFEEIDRPILKVKWKSKGPRETKTTLKKNSVRSYYITRF